jgi:translation initiation factor IF-2
MDTKNSNNFKRSPIVAVMGHIDHGKSTLLSYIRKSKMKEEAGGITQHVSAYEVIHNGSKITFLDTPGHEAFSGIRSRGANVADIAILVVSAEDGVKPQTIEAYKQIKESETPFIVAINKIDKPGADLDKTKMSLAENEIYIEGFGGDVPFVPVSAKTGEGVSELLDMILLVADLTELTGNPESMGTGVVIESNRDVKKGVSATCIVTDGTIKKGMFIVCGSATAPVRIIENSLGKQVDSATLSDAVNIVGWDSLPEVGAPFTTFLTRDAAKEEAETFATLKEEEKKNKTNFDQNTKSSDENTVTIDVIVKADAGGSLEAVIKEIQKIDKENAKVKVQIILSGIGKISENDVRNIAGKNKSIIIGFNVEPDAPAKSLADRNGVEIKTFNIIYKLSEWLADVVAQSTPKTKVTESLGLAKILKVFSKVKDKQIMGGKVERGSITLGSTVKIIRRDAEIGEGKVKELQDQKKRTDEVTEGKEFGMLVEAKVEIAPGDRIESFIIVEK